MTTGTMNGKRGGHKPADRLEPALPSARREEAGVISAVAIDPVRCWPIVAERLTVASFTDDHCRVVFQAMQGLASEGKPIDTTLLLNRLESMKVGDRSALDFVGGEFGLVKMMRFEPNAAHALFYAEEVAKAEFKRVLAAGAAKILEGIRIGEPLESLQELAKSLQQTTPKADRSDVQLLSASELSEGKFTLDYHVAGVLVKGQPAIVAAPQKSLKTSVCVDLALSMASGTDFLGKWPTNPAQVLMLSGESGLGTLQETARRVCYSKNIILSLQKGFTLSTWIPRFDRPEHLASLEQIIVKTGAEVLIIDPAYLCLPGDDAGNMFKMGEALRLVSELCQRRGVTLVLVHHTRKNVEIGAMPELSWIAWSGFSEFCRGWILFNRREPYQPGTGDHRLWMIAGGSAGHGGAWGLDVREGLQSDDGGRIWDVRIRGISDVANESRQANAAAKLDRQEQARQAKEAALRDKILAAVKASGPVTRNQVKLTVKASGTAVNDAVEAMIESGELEPCQVATKGGSFPGVQLGSDKVGQGRTSTDSPTRSGVGRTGFPIREPSVRPTLPGMERGEGGTEEF